jgi:hypothetical protein
MGIQKTLFVVRWSLAAVAMALAPCGCQKYWRDRGNDYGDAMTVGITLSKKPQFAFYPVDYFNISPLGYSHLDARFSGLSGGKWQTLEFHDRTWGVLLWGSDHLQLGEFDPANPRLFAPSKLAELKAAGKEPPKRRPRYNKGAVAMGVQDNAPPPLTFLSCRRNLHLGWAGLHLAMNADEMLDFFLGFTTLDIKGDDGR